jgi:hypothetical protein
MYHATPTRGMGSWLSIMVGDTIGVARYVPVLGPVVNAIDPKKPPKPKIPVPVKPRPVTAHGLWNQFRALPPDVQAASGLGVAGVLALLLGGA